ncbi:ABC transporter permease [Lysinibacillus fusiformis]|uniref:Putative spermidine/putrescine transport system permease protein n=1 Tax=Lysinibacillus fusiformis TaxID=28031 RepID=A0A1H9CX74_9BACI|nr:MULTISPECIES: ABC transporter permease subunit [Lysinibacillus]HAU33870.1 ABC transporter permease [Lysinibacillus sp.]MCG7434318.1 ABC transporter permease subunit [Lysinibacillus fusiformis]MED4074939.1 ABC transporter permease subunit [Lysinibacillus fusiformis]MED4668754.1 ABC transporter permease subunit [Lysinibacillus fusiformis]NOG27437.1 ABC transporter permease subunit [Lysinibacillus fusiformis]
MKKRGLADLFFLLLVGYLILPVLATMLYAFASKWNKTILPEGFTLKWFTALFQDSDFIQAFGRSVLLAGGAVSIALLVIVPAIFVIVLYFPTYEKWIQMAVVMVYSFPGIILAVGLIRVYSQIGIPMIFVVLGAYVVGILPYIYQGTRNSLRNIDARQLLDAAQLLGASKRQAFTKILLPTVYPGLFAGALLSFSVLFGEFVLINLVVGSRFETVQIYLMKKLSTSGHIASAVVFIYIVLMGLLTFVIAIVTKRSKGATNL